MHIPHPHLKNDQRGDTIVEVLIAMVIISSVLAGAFLVTNRSTQNIRDTEEHAQASQLLQGQIEQIRAQISDGATDSDFPSYFCYDPAGALKTLSSPVPQCDDDFNGTNGANYQFLITKSSYVVGKTTTFTTKVQWDGLHGQTNSEQLLYKMEPATP